MSWIEYLVMLFVAMPALIIGITIHDMLAIGARRVLSIGQETDEIPAKYRPVDWNEFEQAVQERLDAAGDPFADINEYELIARAERDMKLVTRKEKEELDRREEQQKLSDLVQELRENDYREWQLLELQGWTAAQIAVDYGVSIKTVRNALDDARCQRNWTARDRDQYRRSENQTESFCVDQYSGEIAMYEGRRKK